MKKELRIGTWNVLTLYKVGVLRQLARVLQDYRALQEICWIGQGVLLPKSKHKFGCGFVVNSKIEHSVIVFKRINHRLCFFRVTEGDLRI
jgi:hypothetical protein